MRRIITNYRSTPGGDGIDRYCVVQLHSMSKATELILMAYKLIYKNMTNSLMRANFVKQAEITMSDGSILIYNIDITLQTEREFSIAYHLIKDTIHGDIIDETELSIVQLFSDCPDDDDEPEDEYDEGSMMNLPAFLPDDEELPE